MKTTELVPENWDDIESELSGIQKVFVLVPVEISMKTEERQVLNVNVDYGIIFNAVSKAVAKGDFFPYNPLEK